MSSAGGITPGPHHRILVDGEELPWHVAPGATIAVDHSECPGVTITLLAGRVEVVDDMDCLEDE